MGQWKPTGQKATTYEVRAPGDYLGDFALIRTTWSESRYESLLPRVAGERTCWTAPGGRVAASLDGLHRSAKDALGAARLEWAQKVEQARLVLEHARKGLAFARSAPRAQEKLKVKPARRARAS